MLATDPGQSFEMVPAGLGHHFFDALSDARQLSLSWLLIR
jgi:hypothetical protein